MLLFPSFILAMFISMLLIPPLIRFAPRIGLVDIPDERKVHVNAIPRVGGVAMVIAALVPMLLWLPKSQEFVIFLISVAIIYFFGVWDDRSDLNYKIKFFGQILAVVLVVIIGGVQIRYIPFMGLEPIAQWISIPLTIFTLLGITNAMNLVDGLDGLAGGTTLIGFGAIGLLSYISTESTGSGNPYIALIAISIMGSTLGFLRFNTHPARIFMGDTGSQFLGFAIGTLAIMVTQQDDMPYNPGIPLILLCWPIFDTLMVMFIRICQGKSPFVADKNHIHHRLLALGLDHYEVVFVIYLVQAILATIAFSLRNYAD
ncbi:MAG: undecaprenyl/decaprenyl-phosphate alpha-N-acetylglucosaminyl 1-phosphate transferase, partial [Gammaproteobacteria bacterium]